MFFYKNRSRVLAPQGERPLGFSLLEILIALAIVGMMSVLVIPLFTSKSDKSHEQAFTAQFNKLMQTGWQQAITTSHIVKILVDIKKQTIELLEQKPPEQGENKETFVPIRDTPADTSMPIPQDLMFVNFFINGQDELTKHDKTATVLFFIMPDGTAQPVIINAMFAVTQEKEKQKVFGLVLNPFSAQFEYYDVAQKP